MKKLLQTTLLILIYILPSYPGFALSQQTSFQISVTIPVIPGVNVALDTQNSLNTSNQNAQQKEDASENSNIEPRKPTIMEIIEQKIIEAEEIVYITLVER